MRNDEHHDDEHELQPEEEQESQLNGPDDDTPSQGTRKRFSLTSTRDGIRRFNAWCDKSPIVSLVSKIVLGVGAILIALFTGIQICEHWVPDYEVVTPGETALPRFSDDIVGILLPRFSGADLREYFGEDGLNRALAIRVAMQLRKEELDSLVEVETISRVIDSEDEAQRVKDSCNAAAIIWGNATKVGGLVDISMIFDAGALAFEAIVPGLEPMEVTFLLRTGPQFTLRLDDSTFNLNALAGTIVTDIMPQLAAKIFDLNPSNASTLLKSLPSRDPSYRKMDYAPFFVQAGAAAEERAGNLEEAIEVYALSFRMFEKLKVRIDSGIAQLPLPDSVLRRFAALSKWQEGHYALRMQDTARALESFTTAMIVDTHMSPMMWRAVHALTGEIVDTIWYPREESPFFQK